LAFSEIEDFPRAVLAHHYPDVPLHGDFTVLRDQPWIVDADVLVGGTPCQAFSVAGLRNSLDDARGNLSLEFVRLADAIDDVRKLANKDPAIIVWENVPGVLSVKDNAFGCFLAGLAGDVDPYVPPRGKWTNAGVVDGPARQVAWRVLDAQYFGLAQRRRRVFVVASARKGFDPTAVLLEFEGVRRDTPPRREKGQAASGGATGRAGERSHWDGDFPHPTLNQSAKASGGVGASNQELFSQRGAYLAPSKWPADIAPTLNAHFGEKQGLEDQHALGGAGLFVPVAHTLKGEGFDASEDGTGRGTPLVPVARAVSLRGRDGGGTAELGGDIQNALRASQGGGDKPHVLAQMAVRRLTPRECERLQGFPDDYTMIPWKKKPAEDCPDGPRYKALGNSMAVPCMRWIGRRVANAIA
jgi:DNA (cytosine-5)-methyltransferase 1